MYSDPKVSNLIVFGDWHGNGHYAQRQLNRIAKNDRVPDAYIHLGDFGIWKHSTDFLKRVERQLAQQNVELWFIDGNHEDFPLLSTYPYDDRGLQRVTKHIFRIPRGYAWQWAGKTLVGMGGAFSVDKRFLKPGYDWFPEEMITEDDFQKTVANGTADVLFTHDAPFLPQAKLGLDTNSTGIRLTPEETAYSAMCRDYVARAIDSLQVKLHMHGHHHIAYTADFFGTTVVGLDCDRKAFDHNAVEVDLNAL